jgi:cysteine-rich repeat protein
MRAWLVLLPLAVACSSGSTATHAAIDNRCKPVGANLFCLCPGGKDTGTQTCLADGTLGPCLPCPEPVAEPDVAQGEPDPMAPVDGSSKPDASGPDSGSAADSGSAPDTAAAKDAGTATDGGGGPPSGSCKDSCGKQSATGKCWCDELCSKAGDCCADIATVCGSATTPNTGKCPGLAIGSALAAGNWKFDGSTVAKLGSETGSGFCALGAGAPDMAFLANPPVRGRVSITLKPAGGFDGHLYVRSGTCSGPQVGCSDFSKEGGVENVVFYVQAGVPGHVFVDGKGAQAGAFQLSGTFQPGMFCGDGIADPGEACDDGNALSGDGCSATCTPDGFPVSAALCPGQAVHLWSLPVDVSATTAKNGNNAKGTCGGGGRESIYALKVHKTGKLTANVTWADFDTALYARRTDCAAGVEVGCSNDVKKVNGGDSLMLDVTDGETVWLFVDGIGTAKGAFQLRLSVK